MFEFELKIWYNKYVTRKPNTKERKNMYKKVLVLWRLFEVVIGSLCIITNKDIFPNDGWNIVLVVYVIVGITGTWAQIKLVELVKKLKK